MARNMVTKYGMSETLGPLYHERQELENLSPATREAVEAEIKGLARLHGAEPPPPPRRRAHAN